MQSRDRYPYNGDGLYPRERPHQSDMGYEDGGWGAVSRYEMRQGDDRRQFSDDRRQFSDDRRQFNGNQQRFGGNRQRVNGNQQRSAQQDRGPRPGEGWKQFSTGVQSFGPKEEPPQNIDWVIAPLSRIFYGTLYCLVQDDKKYWITRPEQLPAEYRALTEEWPGITLRDVFNLRGNLIRDKIVRGHFRIRQPAVRRQICDAYRTKSILHVSRLFDYPPRQLIKAILLWIDALDEKEVDRLFDPGTRSIDDILTKLTARNLTQYNLATRCDAEPKDNAEIALRNEKAFVSLFSEFPHKTEDDLREEGSQTTPDILFTEPITINGIRINWIDYKDYIGTPNTFLSNKLRKQAARYTEAHGQGAFAFNGGFIWGSWLGAMLLDARYCPVGKFSPSYYHDAAEEVSAVDGGENAEGDLAEGNLAEEVYDPDAEQVQT